MREPPSLHRARWAALASAGIIALLPASAADSHPGHGPKVINIGDLKFDPASVNVVEGDYVFFAWNGPDTNHSVTSDAGQSMTFDSDAGKDAGQVNHRIGDGYSVLFKKAGTYTFHCKVHSFMKGTINVGALPASSLPGPTVVPKLSNVSVAPARTCRHGHCAHTGVLVRFTVNEAVSMRATVKRVVHARAVGKVLKEVDFSGPPGANRRKLDIGRRARGGYQLSLVAVDLSTGDSTKPVKRRFSVR